MGVLVNSLKRLYSNGKVTENKLKTMLENGKITADEYQYIISE